MRSMEYFYLFRNKTRVENYAFSKGGNGVGCGCRRPDEKEKYRYATISTIAAMAFWTVLLTLLIWIITHKGGFAF